MATSITPRLKLLLDPLNETDIGVQHDNWDKADTGAGYNLVDPGVVPPVGYNYDGALFAERSNGISGYMNAGVRKRATIPYVYAANYAGPIPTGISTPLGWSIFNDIASVNSSIADRVAVTNAWKAPYSGLYSIHIVTKWDGHPTGQRRVYYSRNGVINNLYESYIKAINGGGSVNRFHLNLNLVAGDIIRPILEQNSGVVLNMTITIQATLLGEV